ncbi:hypothetical protein WDU94_003667, partial [Cyamophila willieti]
SCPFSSCERVLASEFDLKTHYLTHVSHPVTLPDYKCNICDRYSFSELDAKIHSLIHQKFVCTSCVLVFSGEADQKIHFMREHCDEFSEDVENNERETSRRE